jgi:hypothetical protein
MSVVGIGMAVGGGDAFSLPATLLTIILLWSFIQWSAPWWLPELAKKYPNNLQLHRNLDRSLTSLPFVLMMIILLDLARAHFSNNLTYEHVANFGLSDSNGVMDLVLGPVFTNGSPWLIIPISFSAVVIVKEQFGTSYSLFDEGKEANLRARLLRWQGLLWVLILIGFIPSDAFAVYSEPLTFIGSDVSPLVISISLIFTGIFLALWSYSIARFSQFGESQKGDSFIVYGIIVIVSLFFLSMDSASSHQIEQFSELIAMGELVNLSFTAALFLLLLGWPLFLTLLDKVDQIRGVAKGRRWFGLQWIFGYTLALVWTSGALLLEPLPHITGLGSAFWLSLTLILPLAIAGLFGTLLPMAGLDSRPRPEAWGFFLMMTISLPLLTIREPLTAILVPGLFIAMTSALLLATHFEKRPNLLMQHRMIESIPIFIATIVGVWGYRLIFQGDVLGIPLAIACTIVIPVFCIFSMKGAKSVSAENENANNSEIGVEN